MIVDTMHYCGYHALSWIPRMFVVTKMFTFETLPIMFVAASSTEGAMCHLYIIYIFVCVSEGLCI